MDRDVWIAVVRGLILMDLADEFVIRSRSRVALERREINLEIGIRWREGLNGRAPCW
jgi:hypothetical protein